ncbi:solute carrier family 25 member 45 isoform X1 [Ailuropoda melanoleuca]|uniref:solute carrier family 25 member 45 isoform X1 n=2 Tax=Ailuropoda melanoleuca TaxID=9646 RepID=UPI00149433A9|nr:solute carrier family 25 member 45 isoform X1 [Ailuropoda melanoleuca]
MSPGPGVRMPMTGCLKSRAWLMGIFPFQPVLLSSCWAEAGTGLEPSLPIPPGLPALSSSSRCGYRPRPHTGASSIVWLRRTAMSRNTLLALTATSHQERRAQPPSYRHVFIAGCTGGFVQVYCLAPFDLIKVRLQNQTESRARPGSPPPRYRGPVHCAASICQEEGPRGLFRGAWALTLRDTPTLGIYFVTYEWLCRQSAPDGQNPSSATVLVAGGFAGITSWAVATPLDVIKSRMQMAGPKHRVYRGVLDCMARSARQEGLGVFFRGLTINSARAFPVNAVTFLSYEHLLRWWG